MYHNFNSLKILIAMRRKLGVGFRWVGPGDKHCGVEHWRLRWLITTASAFDSRLRNYHCTEVPPNPIMGKKTPHHLRIHAKRRAAERFGLDLNREKLQAIVKEIQSGTADFVDRQSCTVTRYRVVVDGVPVIAVYDKKRKAVRTVLPPEFLENENTGRTA